ncbi:MAG: flagellar motor switch protein FliM, partial [bacterium]
MDRILSQEEINALLANISPDEGAADYDSDGAKICQVYDFKHPDRISKEQLRALRTIHENVARYYSTYLTNALRTLVEIKLISIDQVTFSEYTMSLTVPAGIYVIKCDGLAGRIVVDFAPEFLLHVVDRLLGGTGESKQMLREITLLEQNVVRTVITNLAGFMNDVWAQVLDLGCKYDSFESDPQFIHFISSSDIVVISFFKITVKGVSYTMNFGIPYLLLEPIFAKLVSQNQAGIAQKKGGEESREVLSHYLLASRLLLQARFPKARITIRDFLNFSRNDVLTLDAKTRDEL